MPDDGAADLVLFNAKAITLDEERPNATLVAIKGNTILAVGERHDLARFAGPTTKVLDCAGGTVVPGFNDAHGHPLALAISLLSVDCSPRAARNIAEIQAAIHRRAMETAEGQWIRGTNYDALSLRERRAPNRWELDAVVPSHPVILVDNTGQNFALNSIALRLAGIVDQIGDAQGGKVERDLTTGEPTGIVSGNAEAIKKAVPPLDDEQLEKGVRLANAQYLSHGITSIQDTSWTNGSQQWRTWQRLFDRQAISVRVSLLLGSTELAASIAAGLTMGCGDAWLRVAGVKLALDESTGCPHPPQEAIDEAALQARRAGYRIAFHVSDAHMLAASLAATRFVCVRSPSVQQSFRMEHCSVCPPELIPRLRASRAIVVTQPAFLHSFGQRYKGLTSAHAGLLWPISSLLRQGIRVAFSSDTPLASANPLIGIKAAVTRRTGSGDTLMIDQTISLVEALRCYTLAGAHASGEDGAKGSISPGKLADLALLDTDLAQMEPDRLSEAHVVRTIVDGRVVWES